MVVAFYLGCNHVELFDNLENLLISDPCPKMCH